MTDERPPRRPNRPRGITPRLDRMLADLGRDVERIVLDVAGSEFVPMTGALRGRAMPRITRSLATVYPARRDASSPLERLILDESLATWDQVLVAEADRLRSQLSDRLLAAIDASDDDLAELLRISRMAPERRLAIARALDDTRSWVDPNGHRLSDRVWNARQGVRRAIDQELRLGIVRGEGPRTVARALRQYLAPLVDGQVATLGSRAGHGSYAARRLARTELTRARAQATVEAASRIPTTRGMKWNTSNSHPKTDQCLIAGTMIATATGPKPIESVAVGDYVLTHEGRYRSVTRLYRSQVVVDELRVLRTRGETGRSRQAVMTRSHPVLTAKGWISAGDLHRGDRPIVLHERHDGPLSRSLGDGRRRASQDSARSERAAEHRTVVEARCDEVWHSGRRKHRRSFQDRSEPIGRPVSACDSGHCSVNRPSSSGSPLVAVLQTSRAAVRAMTAASLHGACRSSGSTYRTSGGRPLSNGSERRYRMSERTTSHTWDMYEASRRDPVDNRRWSRTSGRLRSGWAWSETRSRIGRMYMAAWSALGLRRTTWSRNDVSQNATGAPCRTHEELFQRHRLHSVSSYVDYSMPTDNNPLLVDVFNFEVFEDQSYIANGIVVHNCNDHATQDRYGLGAGVYPLTALPTLPAHPHCSCYFTVSFPNREESDRIIRARYGLFEEMA